MEKAILYGTGKYCEEVLTILPGSEKYIHCFADRYTEKKAFFGLPVYRPDVLTAEGFSKYRIVITLKNQFFEVRDSLMREYGIAQERIIYIWQWFTTILSEDESVRIRPESVKLESSTLCQLNCTGCYMRHSNNGTMGSGYLSAKDFRDFLDKNPYVRQIELSNSGEPFLNPDMEEILRLAFERNVRLELINGANFNDVSDAVLEALVRYQVYCIGISLDGASQEVYSVYRRNGDFDKVIRHIRKLNAIKRRYNSEYPKLIWQYVLMQHNQHEAEKAKEMAKELNMKIAFKLNWVKEDFVPFDRDKLREITGLVYFTQEEWNRHNEQPYLTATMCKHMLFSPQINWDGRVLGCNGVFKSDWKVNAFSTDLETALNSRQYRDAIIRMFNGDRVADPDLPCAQCENYQPLTIPMQKDMSYSQWSGIDSDSQGSAKPETAPSNQ